MYLQTCFYFSIGQIILCTPLRYWFIHATVLIWIFHKNIINYKYKWIWSIKFGSIFFVKSFSSICSLYSFIFIVWMGLKFLWEQSFDAVEKNVFSECSTSILWWIYGHYFNECISNFMCWINGNPKNIFIH